MLVKYKQPTLFMSILWFVDHSYYSIYAVKPVDAIMNVCTVMNAHSTMPHFIPCACTFCLTCIFCLTCGSKDILIDWVIDDSLGFIGFHCSLSFSAGTLLSPSRIHREEFEDCCKGHHGLSVWLHGNQPAGPAGANAAQLGAHHSGREETQPASESIRMVRFFYQNQSVSCSSASIQGNLPCSA